MNSLRAKWPEWADFLRRKGLDGFAVWLLEAGGPVNLLGAQFLYMGQPFVTSETSDGVRALANLLEQEDEARAFATLLRRSDGTQGETLSKGQSGWA